MLMQVLVAFALAAAVALFGHLAMPAAKEVKPPATAEAPAVREAATTAAGPAVRVHTVAAGESLSAIAARYAIDVDTLLGANPEADELIHPGDELVVLPQKGVLHVAAAGDTLWALSRAYGVSVAAIQAANGREGDALAVGERLFIPGGRPRGEAVSRAYGQRFVWPAAGEVTSLFGYRWGRHHAGLDIAAEAGAPVRAARAGRVAFAGWYGGYGYAVLIEHGQGYATLYAHLDDYVVERGEYVAAGQRIGCVGDTGYSFGPHLHFEVRVNGQAANPLQYLP